MEAAKSTSWSCGVCRCGLGLWMGLGLWEWWLGVLGCMDGVGWEGGWFLGCAAGDFCIPWICWRAWGAWWGSEGVQLLVAIFWISSCACVLSLWLSTVLWGPLLCIPWMILPVPVGILCALGSSAVCLCLWVLISAWSHRFHAMGSYILRGPV